MTFDMTMYYKLSIFGDFNCIDATPENVVNLLTLFKDERFMPTTVKEAENIVTFGLPELQLPSGLGKTSNRIMLSSPNNEWSIMFGAKRIDIQQHPYNDQSRLDQNINDFLPKAKAYCEQIMSDYKLISNRLALNSSEYCSKMSKNAISDYGSRLSELIKYYSKTVLDTWTTRFVTHKEFQINETCSLINVITTLDKFQGDILQNNAPKHIESIKVDFDINSNPDNKSRFTSEDIETFYNNAKSDIEEIKRDLG